MFGEAQSATYVNVEFDRKKNLTVEILLQKFMTNSSYLIIAVHFFFLIFSIFIKTTLYSEFRLEKTKSIACLIVFFSSSEFLSV